MTLSVIVVEVTIQNDLHADPSCNLCQACIIVRLIIRSLQSLLSVFHTLSRDLVMTRRQSLVLQIHLSCVFKVMDGLLDTLGTQHQCTGRELAARSRFELGDALRLFTKDLEHTGEATDGEDLVLDCSSFGIGGFGISFERRRSGCGDSRWGGILFEFLFRASVQYCHQHVCDLFANEG